MIEYIGAILGILGAILVTSKETQLRFIAFNLWILSNSFLMYLYITSHMYGLVAMCSVYTITSCIGWWNNRKD